REHRRPSSGDSLDRAAAARQRVAGCEKEEAERKEEGKKEAKDLLNYSHQAKPLLTTQESVAISFYEKNGITFQNPKIVQVTPDRWQELQQKMGLILDDLNKGKNELMGYLAWLEEKCLGDDPEEAILLFQQNMMPRMMAVIEEQLRIY